MAAVSVFVDDAVRGRLPLVCAKTGAPSDLVVRMRQEVRRSPGIAWLLVFFGPPGWVALWIVSALGANSEYLTVRIPQSRAAFDREKQLERSRLAAFAAGVLVIVTYGLTRPVMFPTLWLLTAAALLVAGVVLHAQVSRQTVRVSLDASRRWVTLAGVHPDFVRAVERTEAAAR